MNVPGFMTAGHIKYKGVNVMKNKKENRGHPSANLHFGSRADFCTQVYFYCGKDQHGRLQQQEGSPEGRPLGL